jgi:hypothetical protein
MEAAAGLAVGGKVRRGGGRRVGGQRDTMAAMGRALGRHECGGSRPARAERKRS